MPETHLPNKFKVACVGRAFGPEAQALIRDVVPAEFEISFEIDPGEKCHPLIRESDFILTTAPITEKLIRESPRLRLIHKWGIGVDKIDLAAAEREGVPVAITAGSNAVVVAEHTIMLIIAALRQLSLADRSMREGKWIYTELRPKCRKLSGKTVGILGFGNIGKNVAKRLAGFDVEIIYHDPFRSPPEIEKQFNARFVSFDELMEQSDILTLHCPGGAANHRIINAAAIARMKRGSVLVNAARGDVVDEDAVVAALESGQLLAAGLDAFEPEPLPPTSKLTKLENVVLTPHTAGSVLDNVVNVALHAFNNMLRLARGEEIPASDIVVRPARSRDFAKAS
ncbi:2-hydroxyacid dehydrogenase [Sinorhizobium mexicanum]|uniref:2-hydroxyacid dehydrogenase n=1 Tax=Sinorhizobium mexicanum TaxID=375549 RepID=UPI0015DF9AE3|nr:2-hydroxyacid dehydrogenase [Sinorhizobium mexicanum]MBP1883773.1 D-3-phosphoglycerate dehydrogenase [Sinorhizobium mexicanum]